MTRTAGWVLLAGAAAFVGVAFAPASFVFGISDRADRRAYLERHARSWRWGQLPFAAGAVVSAVGLLCLGLQLHGASGAAVTVAGVAAVLASLPWVEHCRQRAVAIDDFLEGRLPGWHFVIFCWGTLAALAVTGVALLGTELPSWTGWFVLAATALLVAALLRFRDLPPFVFYIVTGVLGAAAL
ncbi:MAG TPA: hypothetical protein VM097_01275 [Mycobacteriales bacterium]|nr:hypothetical protein [Mycobacteriales bacterium]